MENYHHHMIVVRIVASNIDKSFSETSLLMLDEKPMGTLTPRKNLQMLFSPPLLGSSKLEVGNIYH
jgi:hypothetical protein